MGRLCPSPPASARPAPLRPSRAPSPYLGMPLGHHIPGTCWVVAGGLLLMHLPSVDLLPGGDRGQVRVDWRKLHRRGHLLGAWGSAHQNQGIPAAAGGCPGSARLSLGPSGKGWCPWGLKLRLVGVVMKVARSWALSLFFPGSLKDWRAVGQRMAHLGVPGALPVSRPHTQLASFWAWFPGT